VLTTELPTRTAARRTPRRLLPLRPSPSAVVAHIGCRSVDREMPHHHIVFGDAWEQTFRDIIDDGAVMRDPSLLVTRPTAGDRDLAPDGRELLYVLAPAPNLSRGNVNWDAIGDSYAEGMLAAVTDRLPQLGSDAELLHIVNPADWGRQGMATAHRSHSPTPSVRPGRSVPPTPCAASTTPCWPDRRPCRESVCRPALVSGRLAADRITGAATRRIATHIGSGT
jgi:phytoene desaturase